MRFAYDIRFVLATLFTCMPFCPQGRVTWTSASSATSSLWRKLGTCLRQAPAHPRDVLSDPLGDGGMMSDCVVELKKIRQWVEAAGFEGYAEVETFSAMDWRQLTREATLDTCIARHRSVV